MEDTERNHQLASLRLLIGMWEKNPTLPIPYGCRDTEMIAYCWSESEQKEAALALGPFSKVYTDDYYDLVHNVGVITYIVRTNRETSCEATVVGTRTVTKRVCVTPAVYEEQEVEEDVIEWDCSQSLLS